MPVKLLTSGGGGVNLVPSSSIASDQTMYLPTSGTAGGTVLCTDSTGGTANGVLYLNSSKQVTSGSGLVFDSSGNLGLGVTPSAWGQGRAFELLESGTGIWNGSGSPGSLHLNANAYFNGGFKYGQNGYATNYNQYQGQHVWNIASSGTAGNAITFTQAMTLDSSGNLLVGTTSSGVVPNGLSLTTNAGSGYSLFYVGHPSGTGSGASYAVFRYNDVTIGNISQNGTAAVSYNTSSDYRLKENIQPMTGALATVAQLNPVRYTWKADGSAGQGFIAHELQAVVPDCVTGEKDAVDEEGKPIYQGIDTSFLVATLTAAIQELSAQNKELTQRIEALEYTKQGE